MAHYLPTITLLDCPYEVMVIAEDVVDAVSHEHSPRIRGRNIVCCDQCGPHTEGASIVEHAADMTARMLIDRLGDLGYLKTRPARAA